MQQLEEVGDRLQEAVRAGAVRPVAELHPRHHLPLGERQVGERHHDEVDHDEGLDQAHPPLGLRHQALHHLDGSSAGRPRARRRCARRPGRGSSRRGRRARPTCRSSGRRPGRRSRSRAARHPAAPARPRPPAAGTRAPGRARPRRRRRAGGTGGGAARRRSARRRAPGAAPAPASSPASGCSYGVPAGQRCAEPDVVEREVAEEARAQLLVDARCVRRDLDVEPLGELADPGELVRARRKRRPAQPLDAALEVHRRPVALERSRSREGSRRPSPRRGRGTSSARSRAPACSASARTLGSDGRLVAGDDAAARSARGSPRRRRPRPPRRPRRRARWRWREGGMRRSRACPRSRARARARRCARRLRRRAPTRRAPPAPPSAGASRARCAAPRAPRTSPPPPPGSVWTEPVGEQTTTSAPRRRASLIQRSTIGARSATGSSPTTTTRLRVADRGERQPECVERVRGRLRQHGRVRAEPVAEERPERERDLHRLRSRERGHDRAARLAQERLDLVERLVPGDLAKTLRPAAKRGRDAVLRAEVRIREAALVAQPAAVDLRVVAAQDPPHLPLADRRRDVASDRAAGADRRHVLDLPRPRLRSGRAWTSARRPGTAR